jgi:hypothetical protein
MGSLGVHFALSQGVAERLLAADGNDDDVASLVEEIEEEQIGIDHCDTDKAWDAIHRSLTDGGLGFDNGRYPLNAAVLGGRQLYGEEDYIVSLLTPEQVGDVADALVGVSREALHAGYTSIDPGDYGPEFGAEDFEYTWDNFTDLVDFYQRAARAHAYVIFTVDQ